MSLLIRCRNVFKSYGDRQVLGGIDWEIHSGDRIGLVGRNGCGKSTLASILGGLIDTDQGQISYHPPGLSLGLLCQDGAARGHGMSESCPDADSLDRQMLSRLQLRNIGAETETCIQADHLSGGERTRLALARLWSGQPHLLILDEPTNNLDIDGMDWLASELALLPAAVIIISHDRRFLDRTVNQVVELQDGRLIQYNGNYSFYKEEKERRYQSQLRAYESQVREEQRLDGMIRQLKGWSDKGYRESRRKGRASGNRMGSKEYYRARAEKKDRAVKSQIRRLEKMRQEGQKRPRREIPALFQSLENGSGGKRLLAARDLAMSYGERPVFSASDFWINRGEKAGIIGPNGCGKTTLLKILTGEEEASAGELFFSPASRIAYISQDTPGQELPALRQRLSGIERQALGRICTAMARLGLDWAALNRPGEVLSPGERMKMAIALAIDTRPDLIILDEPGNHLDLFSLESLQQSLQDYNGSLLLVSHDVYLVQQVCNCLLAFENGRITRQDCTMEEYLARRPLKPEPFPGPGAAERQNLQSGPDKRKQQEQALLLDNQIAYILGQLSLEKAGSPRYQELDTRYRDLCHQKALI